MECGLLHGEEAYSLAILLRQAIPKIELAGDHPGHAFNERFLQRAEGIYGEWSFRGTQEWLKGAYFQRLTDGRHAIRPEIRRMVSFAQLNSVEDQIPSLLMHTNAMDVIFCRNVLMYFQPATIQRVIEKLHRALAPGGWLVLEPARLPMPPGRNSSPLIWARRFSITKPRVELCPR
ncbi:MAG: CheR family methyltransferase [Chthoniobacteraceae bacterium]